MKEEGTQRYMPQILPETWSERDRRLLEPFATNLDGHVHVLRNLPPEIVGALCSRASRAPDSLLRVLLKEYFYPIADGENKELAHEFETTVDFLRDHGFKNILNNQRAQSFYAKWLSQYGDDSIAQMTGTHICFPHISQVAMKFIEDRRIGLEPIEKSTRYVNFGVKSGGRYLYYTPTPDLERAGLLKEYTAVVDHLFETYGTLLPKLMEWLKSNFAEKESILEKKAFDTLRGLLPMATVGQVAFRGNAQAFEYLLNRSARHPIGELRWISEALKTELEKEIPSLLLRISDPKSVEYQTYLVERDQHAKKFIDAHDTGHSGFLERGTKPEVHLVDADPDSEVKILAGIIFPLTHTSWETSLAMARKLSSEEKDELFALYLKNRTARWQKVGRAFENAYLRFEILMNIGSYRDLHRHRMMTQERQLFSCHHGYDIPSEIKESGLLAPFTEALDRAGAFFGKLEKHSPELAQYVVPLAYRIRFFQWKNFRQMFWEAELRTISQGHPDYRFIEQEKFRLVKERFPRLAKHMLVDMKEYSVARRGTEEVIAAKEKDIIEKLQAKQR